MASLLSHNVLERPTIIVPVALLLLAAAAGVMWTGAARHVVPQQILPAHTQAAAPSMLISTANIARGQMLTGRDFTLGSAGADAPKDALHRPEDAQGHMALEAVGEGMPLRSSQVSATVVPGLAAHVPEGYRAYALPVSDALTAGGFLQAGDHVDLYITLPGALFGDQNALGAKQSDQSKSALLLQNIVVLAVGTKTDIDGKPDTTMRTVTLALNAADLAKVSLSNRLGTISFAIRNPVDSATQAETPPAILSNIAGTAPPVQPAAARKSAAFHGIPMLAGRNRTVIPLP